MSRRFDPGIFPDYWYTDTKNLAGCDEFSAGSKQVAQFCKTFTLYVTQQNAYSAAIDSDRESLSLDEAIHLEKVTQSQKEICEIVAKDPDVPTHTAHSLILNFKFRVRNDLTYCQNQAFNRRGILETFAAKKELEVVTGKASKPLNDFSRLNKYEQNTCNTILKAFEAIEQSEYDLDQRVRKSLKPTAKESIFKKDESIESACQRIVFPHPSEKNTLVVDRDSMCLFFSCYLLHLGQKKINVMANKELSDNQKMSHGLHAFRQFSLAAKIVAECPDVPEEAASQFLHDANKSFSKSIHEMEENMLAGFLHMGTISDLIGGRALGKVLKGELPDLSDLDPTQSSDVADPAIIQRLTYPGQRAYRGMQLFQQSIHNAEETLRKRQLSI